MQDTGTHPYPRPASRQRGIVGGSGDENDRGVVHVDEGPVGLEPYPLRAAAILEDAYQVSRAGGLVAEALSRQNSPKQT